MKKYLLLLLSLLTIAIGAKADVEINSENFPDTNFRSFLLAQDYGKDGKLTDAEIAGISALNLTGKSIASLRGIKYFTALTTLRIWVNQIGEAEMEHVVRELPYQSSATMFVYNPFVTAEQNRMSSLQYYVARGKGWTSFCNSDPTNMYEIPMDMLAYSFAPTIVAADIDATTFPDANFRQFLIDEGYGYNCVPLNRRYLTFEDIEGITTLDVGYKDIQSLQGVEHFTALKTLFCCGNQLTTLDVSSCTELTKLDCSNNQLTSLDVSNCSKLNTLYCYANNIEGDNMLALLVTLPKNGTGNKLYVIVDNSTSTNPNTTEQNVCTKTQVKVAKMLGWTPYIYRWDATGIGQWVTEAYEGSDAAKSRADVNADGTVDVADIASVIDEMAASARTQSDIEE